jgi:hypothetical protein
MISPNQVVEIDELWMAIINSLTQLEYFLSDLNIDKKGMLMNAHLFTAKHFNCLSIKVAQLNDFEQIYITEKLFILEESE